MRFSLRSVTANAKYMRLLTSSLKSIINAFFNGQLALTLTHSVCYPVGLSALLTVQQLPRFIGVRNSCTAKAPQDKSVGFLLVHRKRYCGQAAGLRKRQKELLA